MLKSKRGEEYDMHNLKKKKEEGFGERSPQLASSFKDFCPICHILFCTETFVCRNRNLVCDWSHFCFMNILKCQSLQDAVGISAEMIWWNCLHWTIMLHTAPTFYILELLIIELVFDTTKENRPLWRSQVFCSFKLFTKRNLAPCRLNELLRCLSGVYKLFTDCVVSNERMLKMRALLLLRATPADGELLTNCVAGFGIGSCSWTPVQCMLHETSHL